MSAQTALASLPAAIPADKLRAFLGLFQELFASVQGQMPAGRSLQAVGNELLTAKARAGKTPGYLKTLRSELGKVFRGQLRRDVSTVRPGDLEAWIYRPEYAPKTQRNLIISARAFFGFAARRGYVAVNPADALEMPARENKPVAIQSPDAIRALLRYAERQDVAIARLLAVQYFGGLRASEALRLVEAEIGPSYIEITAEKCKTRRRRLVAITPTLRVWLDATAAVGARLPITQAQTRLARVRGGSGVVCPHNAARHSFCSYHLAQGGSASKTAFEAGHSEAVLFAHYRELVTPEAAAEFWNIRPRPQAALAPLPENIIALRLSPAGEAAAERTA